MRERRPFIHILFMSFLLIFSGLLVSTSVSKTQAYTTKENEYNDSEKQEQATSRNKKSHVVSFKIKRAEEQYFLENLKIEQNFGTISSITIEMPEGLNLAPLSVPAGWSTYNKPDDNVLNYLLTQNNTPEIVQHTLQQLTFNINNEELTEGKISISVSEEQISSWQDPEGITHYYKFVPNSLPWLDAYNAAKKERYKGLTGYLATITSVEEHDYIFNSIAKVPGMLGGTRALNKNGTKISDIASISTAIGNYNLTKDEWYWASGPETGDIFFIGKGRPGKVPAGKYDGWTPTEPNNNGGSELFLQFAQVGKLWNDLPNLGNIPANRGYYVEFSEYGTQKETEENSYSADVPQLVKVVYLDEQDQQKIAEEIIVSKNFYLGDAYDTTSFRKEIADYELVQLPIEKGTHQNEPQTVTYYYKRNSLTLHIKQVVLEPSSELVVPTKGYVTLKSVDKLNPAEVGSIYEELNISYPSRLTDAEEAGVYQIAKNKTHDFYQVVLVLPEYYQNEGYVLTDVEAVHDVSQKQQGIPVLKGKEKAEYWLTLYIKPNGPSFRPYHWYYQMIDMN